MEGNNPGVPATPPVETPTTTPAATGDTTPQAAPSPAPVSEDVNTPPAPDDKHVPYDRFKEVNDKAKAEAQRREELEAELETYKNPPAPQEEAPQLDPEVQKVLDEYVKSKGFVTQEEIRAKEVQAQADADVRALKAELADFDKDTVLDFAKERGLMINDKNGLRAVYDMWKAGDATAKDAMRNEILAELKEKGQLADTFVEKPGAGGARMTPTEQPKGVKGILHAAIERNRS